MRAGDDAVLDRAVVERQAECAQAFWKQVTTAPWRDSRHLLAADSIARMPPSGMSASAPAEDPVALGAERERADEAHAAFRRRQALDLEISVISGQASCTAFLTPAWKVSADAGQPSQAPMKRTSIAGGTTLTSSTSPPWEASIGRTLSSATLDPFVEAGLDDLVTPQHRVDDLVGDRGSSSRRARRDRP